MNRFPVPSRATRNMSTAASPPKKSATVRGSVKIGGGIGQVATYLGRRPPPEVKIFVEMLPQTPEPLLKRIAKFVIEYIKGTQINEDQWQKLLQQAKEVGEEECRMVFAGLLVILKTAVRDKVDTQTFTNDLEALTIIGPPCVVLVGALKELYVIIPASSITLQKNAGSRKGIRSLVSSLSFS